MISLRFKKNVDPWIWFYHKHCLSKQLSDTLFESYSHEHLPLVTRCSGSDKMYISSRYSVCEEDDAAATNINNPTLTNFLGYLKSEAYRNWLSQQIGCNLREAAREIVLTSYDKGAFMGPHTDSADKIVTQLFYLNTAPPEAGGDLILMNRSKEPVQIITPKAGASVMFQRSDHSWHEVSPIRSEGFIRKAIQVVFWHKQRVATPGRRYFSVGKPSAHWKLHTVDDTGDKGPITIAIDGSKHTSVPLLATAFAAKAECIFNNIPDLLDIEVWQMSLAQLQCKITRDSCRKIFEINSDSAREEPLNDTLLGSVHGSIYLIPAMLCRFNRVELFTAGGCALGPDGQRPMHHILGVLQSFGASVDGCTNRLLTMSPTSTEQVVIHTAHYSSTDKQLAGPCISGVTKTALIMAAGTNRPLKIWDYYRKQDVLSMVEFLRQMGHQITMSSDCITVMPRPHQQHAPIHYTIPSDPIEIVTFMALAGIRGKEIYLTVTNVQQCLADLKDEMQWFEASGFRIIPLDDNRLWVAPPKRLHNRNIHAKWDGLYSDSVPSMTMLALLRGIGAFTIKDDVWSERWQYLQELADFLGNHCLFEGPWPKITPFEEGIPAIGRALCGEDLRSVVALMFFAIGVGSNRPIYGIEHLRRGHVDMFKKMEHFGVYGQVKEA